MQRKIFALLPIGSHQKKRMGAFFMVFVLFSICCDERQPLTLLKEGFCLGHS